MKLLCKTFDGDVFLTARNQIRGLKAVEDLNKEGLHPKFHELDISSKESVENLTKFLQKHYDGLDILIQNAAISFEKDSTVSSADQVK